MLSRSVFDTNFRASVCIQEFLAEVKDQQKRMGTVITSGRHMMMERHWPKETAEGLKAGCSGVENRWKWVCSEAEEWGKLLETVLPEMEKFQVRILK